MKGEKMSNNQYNLDLENDALQAAAFQQELELRQLSESDLSESDIYNLKTYGALSPMEFAPDPFDSDVCLCGKSQCPDAYDHISHGF